MSLRNEQCNKVCRILDDVLANRPTERDSLITAVRKAFGALETEPHWIPCSERLPKEKQSVLVTDGSVVWVCDIISTDEGYKWEDSHGYWLDLDEWKAWRPLPEPYQGGEK